jgi:hypothetical protein
MENENSWPPMVGDQAVRVWLKGLDEKALIEACQGRTEER